MPDYHANISLHDAAAMLLRHKRIVVTTHAKPDGDAFGSVVALSTALRNAGLDVQSFFMPPVPASFRQLRGAATVKTLNNGDHLPEADLTVIIDTGAWSQLSPIRDDLAKRLDKTLILDHHLSGDVEAACRYIDGKAAASCEIVGDLLDALAAFKEPPGLADKLYDLTVAEAIFVGLASDSGWFRFSNTRPRTHELAARLLRLGVDHAGLYRKLEQADRPEKLLLLIRALNGMKLVAGGRGAVMVLKADDFAQAGALLEETERFVDIPQMVATVEVVALITETPPSENSGRAGAETARLAGGRSA